MIKDNILLALVLAVTCGIVMGAGLAADYLESNNSCEIKEYRKGIEAAKGAIDDQLKDDPYYS